MKLLRLPVLLLLAAALFAGRAAADDRWITFEGKSGPGQGKHVVFIAGDHEYRSEEALPQLAKIVARHGFKTTVLFSQDDDGTINPGNVSNIPGLEALKSADLMVLGLRFRDLKDDQMQHIADYVAAGKPIVALRTSTHSFDIKGKDKKYAAWDWQAKDGGFGKKILGETWVAHHGGHGTQSTRGIIAPEAKNHPIVRGIKDGDVWGPTDVYTVNLPLPGDSQPILLGQVLTGMKFDDPPLEGKKNDPMMPLVWTKTYQGENGKKGRVVTSTLGAATDFTAEGSRRMFVNAVYWALGLEDKIPKEGTKVDLVGEYDPTPFGFGKHVKGKKPADYAK